VPDIDLREGRSNRFGHFETNFPAIDVQHAATERRGAELADAFVKIMQEAAAG